jgi:hypothetical protein
MYVRWLAFVAEMMLMSASKVDPVKSKMAIASRRATNYQSMRQLMAESDNWDKTSTVFSLVVAAIAEFRAGDALVARKHLKMAVELLDRRKGLRTIQEMAFTEGMIVLYAFTSLDLPILRSSRDLDGSLRRWMRAMTLFEILGKMEVGMSKELRAEFVPTSSGKQWALQLACLHALSSVLSRCTRVEAGEYVRILENMAKSSRGLGGALAPVAIFFMLGSVAERMGWWHTGLDNPWTSWETIELIALLNLAPRTRMSVLTFLASRILDDGSMLEVDVDEIEAEIFVNWDLKHGSHAGAVG